MSYQVIARKFRPQTFADVLGQEHITKALGRAMETKRIHHAYLFTGGRGVGKTSTARILAKALNCEKGPTPMPCGVCKPCTEITQGISLDVREIDGASNTGVDDIRELRENVKYLPAAGKYRVFIIDEVHMLSTSAFNALLKTLEEPPAHVLFIFATTEPHKILDTILSRCQRYDFRLLTHAKILEQLELIAKGEALTIDKAALHLLAQEAAGSMRDAETLLEQVISFAEGMITADTVTQSLGLIDRKILREAVGQIIRREPSALMRTVRSLHEFGHDIKHFVQDLLGALRNLSMIKACQAEGSSFQDLLELPEDEVSALVALTEQGNLEDFERLYQLLNQDFYSITHATNQRIALEMALLRLVQSPPLSAISELIEEVRTLKRGGAQTQSTAPSAARPPVMSAPVSAAAPIAKLAAKPFAAAKPAAPVTTAATGADLWEQLIQALRATNPKLASSLREVILVTCSAQEVIARYAPNPFLSDLLTDADTRTAILSTLKQLTGAAPRLEFRSDQSMEPPKTESLQKAEERQRLSEQLKDHPLVKNIQTVFGAEIREVKSVETPK